MIESKKLNRMIYLYIIIIWVNVEPLAKDFPRSSILAEKCVSSLQCVSFEFSYSLILEAEFCIRTTIFSPPQNGKKIFRKRLHHSLQRSLTFLVYLTIFYGLSIPIRDI